MTIIYALLIHWFLSVLFFCGLYHYNKRLTWKNFKICCIVATVPGWMEFISFRFIKEFIRMKKNMV